MRATFVVAGAVACTMTGTLAGMVAGCAGTPGRGRTDRYVDESTQTMFEASVQLRVGCWDGRSAAGAGVAVTPRHVITARHVVEACGPEEPRVIVGRVGTRAVEMVVEEAAIGVDAVRLVVVGVGEPFRTWATPDPTPARLGQDLCAVVGDGRSGVAVLKCGRVFAVGRDWFGAAVPFVRGNSGGALFDAAGRVRGVLSRGQTDPGGERFGVAVAAAAWRKLVPREGGSLASARMTR